MQEEIELMKKKHTGFLCLIEAVANRVGEEVCLLIPENRLYVSNDVGLLDVIEKIAKKPIKLDRSKFDILDSEIKVGKKTKNPWPSLNKDSLPPLFN